MKNLHDILEGIPHQILSGSDTVMVSGIAIDSRQVTQGGLFIAIRGTEADGHDFLQATLDHHVKAIICERWPEKIDIPQQVTVVKVAHSRKTAGIAADNFFDHPSAQLQLIGVTGTNGKSTTVTLLHQLLSNLGEKTGMLSTIENRIGNRKFPAQLTTPDPISLHKFLRQMVDEGCEFAVMEVSSHALDQQRVAGVTWAGAIFTNLSHDHLDYHTSFADYRDAKKKLFDQLPASAFALTNIDDRNGQVMVQNSKAKIYIYSLSRPADFTAKILENEISGLALRVNGQDIFAQLIGVFNAYNLLAVYAVGVLLDFDKQDLLQELSALQPVRGRFEPLWSQANNITAIVDYAHTPDALAQVLETISDINVKGDHVVTVVGCGGNRDKTKRPIMARVAWDHSDTVVLTSDNPRYESPGSIIEDMIEGLPSDNYSTDKIYLVEPDRKRAIELAISRLKGKGGIVLVAGKGHETYQEIKGERRPMNDKKIIEEYMNSKS